MIAVVDLQGRESTTACRMKSPRVFRRGVETILCFQQIHPEDRETVQRRKGARVTGFW